MSFCEDCKNKLGGEKLLSGKLLLVSDNTIKAGGLKHQFKKWEKFRKNS